MTTHRDRRVALLAAVFEALKAAGMRAKLERPDGHVYVGRLSVSVHWYARGVTVHHWKDPYSLTVWSEAEDFDLVGATVALVENALGRHAKRKRQENRG